MNRYAPAGWMGPTWAGPTVVQVGRGKPTWAGPTVVQV